MDLVDRLFAPFAAVGLVAAALVGFLIGAHRPATSGSSSAPAAAVALGQSLLTSRVAVDAPADWRAVNASSAVPGLSLTRTQALAPPGQSGSQLIVGFVGASAPTPLPPGLVLSHAPLAEVIQLPQAEALRYANLSVSGYDGLLTLYALPVPGEATTLIACQAPASGAGFIRECERAVASVRPVGPAGVLNLTPNAGYAQAISATIATLETRRSRLRARLHEAPGASTAAAARALAAAFAHASAVLSHVEPPPPAGDAQAALGTSLLADASAYKALAAAVGSSGAYEAARGQVASAESATNSALSTYALLGYRLTR